MNKINLFKMTAIAPVHSVKWAFDFASWQPTESQILQAFCCIQPEEKERIGRLLFKRDVKASLIGRLMIRKFLVENSNLPYNEIFLKRDDHGKPFIDNDSVKGKLNFSTSHHGRLVVFVGHVSDVKIGVDVMTVKYEGGKDLNEFFRIMSRNFSEHEWNIIKNTSSSNHIKMMLFNRHWALKESYLKAIGTGITVDLRKVEFRIKTKFLKTGMYTNDTELYLDNVKQSDWLFQESLVQSDHLIAIAVNSRECEETSPLIFLSYDDFVKNSIPLLSKDSNFCKEFMEKDEEPY